MGERKLFNRDFVLVVIGQIISLFGNVIIRFALPLYLLDITGSSAMYGMALAVSMISFIILSPIGGVMADRVNKRNIMVALDSFTAIILILVSISKGSISPAVVIIMAMIILFGIQGIYQPAVQASIPLLSDEKYLLKANSIINQVSSLSSLVGPIIGGIIYGFKGIWPIIGIGTVCFALSAVMEVFIHMPDVPQKRSGGLGQIIIGDLKEGLHFCFKEKPIVFKIAIMATGINLMLSSMLVVGTPVIIKINLGLSNQLYGYAQSTVGIGSLLGGLYVSIRGDKLKIEKSYLLLSVASLITMPISMALELKASPLTTYGIIIIAAVIAIFVLTIFNIQFMTYIQSQTPVNLIGKVGGCVTMICTCSQPIGQAIYGLLFQWLSNQPEVVLLIGAGSTFLLSLVGKGIFSELKETKVVSENSGLI